MTIFKHFSSVNCCSVRPQALHEYRKHTMPVCNRLAEHQVFCAGYTKWLHATSVVKIVKMAPRFPIDENRFYLFVNEQGSTILVLCVKQNRPQNATFV